MFIIATLNFRKTTLRERKISTFTNIYTNLPGLQCNAGLLCVPTLILLISSDLSKLQNLRDELFRTLNILERQNQQNFDERSDQENISLYSSFSDTFQVNRIQYCENHAWMSNVTHHLDGYTRIEDISGVMREGEDRIQLSQSRRSKEKAIINVGGEKHEVMWRMLEKHPRSRLGLLALSNSTDQVDKD